MFLMNPSVDVLIFFDVHFFKFRLTCLEKMKEKANSSKNVSELNLKEIGT